MPEFLCSFQRLQAALKQSIFLGLWLLFPSSEASVLHISALDSNTTSLLKHRWRREYVAPSHPAGYPFIRRKNGRSLSSVVETTWPGAEDLEPLKCIIHMQICCLLSQSCKYQWEVGMFSVVSQIPIVCWTCYQFLNFPIPEFPIPPRIFWLLTLHFRPGGQIKKRRGCIFNLEYCSSQRVGSEGC